MGIDLVRYKLLAFVVSSFIVVSQARSSLQIRFVNIVFALILSVLAIIILGGCRILARCSCLDPPTLSIC